MRNEDSFVVDFVAVDVDCASYFGAANAAIAR